MIMAKGAKTNKIEPGITAREMVDMALRARQNAYAPYSGFHVGAAVLADNGKIYTGCNIENSSFGATICAERAAIAKAITDGAKKILAVAVTSDSEGPTHPCCICRQVMSEFLVAETPLYLSNRDGDYQELIFRELLPNPFVLKPHQNLE